MAGAERSLVIPASEHILSPRVGVTLLSDDSNHNLIETRDVDIAVVGGGVAGAYAAWRLLQTEARRGPLQYMAALNQDDKIRVELFEYSGRIGGRLYSLRLPGAPHLPIELGGMRFLNTHKRVMSLVGRFGLEARELLVEDKEGRNLYFLRGQHFAASDWKRASFSPPFDLAPQERGRTPGELLAEVALRYEKNADNFRDTGFWNLLLRELSKEAYDLARQAGGYDTLVNNWSAAEAIPFLLADFPADARYMALNKGFQSLPLTLAKEFEDFGGRISLKHRLHRIDWDEERQQIELLFDTTGGSPDFVVPQAPSSDNALRVRARHVILAMPRRAIELLHPDSVLFQSATFQNNLRSVLAQPAFKIFAAYRRPWWTETRGVVAGRALTDLPIRQCYYWGTEESAPRGETGVKNSILMASYSDGNSVEFWAGLARHPERYSAPPHAFPPGVGIPPFVQELSASQRLVEELQSQLRLLHGLNRLTPPTDGAQLLDPYVTVYRDWTKEPFGGGWHFWKIGSDARKIVSFMRRPFEKLPLSICGEAWSQQQGWVEGALETTDGVFESVFDLPPFA
jgi:protoporphyrinogen oxidase